MYDVIIIGAGVIGASIARELSRYQMKIIVLEKENDVCNATSMANSAIVHSGYDPKPGTLKAKLNVEGNAMYDVLCRELDVEFARNGSITIANSEEEISILNQLVENSKINQVPVRLLSKQELFKLEPNLNSSAVAGLFAPTAGIVNPFELTIGLMENAMDNGVELRLNETVEAITTFSDYYEVKTSTNRYLTRLVINAAGVHADTIAQMIGNNSFRITPRKGIYFVLDHFKEPYVSHTLFPVPSKVGKGVLVTPTTHGNFLIGPTSSEVDDSDDKSTEYEGMQYVRQQAARLVAYIPFQHTIRSFAGLRAVATGTDFIIREDDRHPRFFHVAGIQSPGLASAPAIAKMVRELVLNSVPYPLNPLFNPIRRPLIRMDLKSEAERQQLIERDAAFGRIICRCEHISEGEIVDAIHRNCGARSVKAIKKRVRPGFGKCQGGFCEPLVVKILARELHQSMLEVVYDSQKSPILLGETKQCSGGDKE